MAHKKQNRSLVWGLLGLAILTALGCGSIFDTGYGPNVQNGSVEVFYVGGATQDEANSLAAYLNKDLTAGDKKRSVQLKKSGETYQVRVVIQTGLQNDEKTKTAMQILGARVSQEVLKGAAVEVHICDEKLKTISVLPTRDDLKLILVQGKVEIFYSNDNLKTDAKNLADHLNTLFKDSATTKAYFKLAKRDKTFEVHMVTNEGQWNDAEFVKDIAVDAKDMGRKVFGGSPAEIHLCDDVFNVKKVVK